MAGVKIQFIRRDGKVIEVLAERFDIAADRAIGVFPIPVTGERIGSDLNQITTKIEIDGIIIDDEVSAPSAATASTANIDFTKSTTADSSTWAATFAGSEAAAMALLHGQLTDYTTSGTGATIIFISETQAAQGNGNQFVFQFTTNAGLHGAAIGNNIGVYLNAASMVTYIAGYAYVATQLHNAMTTSAVTKNDAIAAGVVGTFASAFTATLSAVTFGGVAYGNALLTLVQTITGVQANGTSPTFWTPDQQQIGGDGFLSIPRHQMFYGGSISSRKSAGDKVQDLYAAVANNNVAGAIGTVLDNSALGGLSFDLTDMLGRGETFVSSYIIGIKVPFESLKQSSDGSAVLRNFILLTGAGNRGDADANTEAFSTAYDWQNKKTGIMGTIVSFSAEQQGGQKYFDFTATFQPLDMIVGI